MNQYVLTILLALLLCGCGELIPSNPSVATVPLALTESQLREQSAMNIDSFGCWMSAIDGVTNRDEILERYRSAVASNVVELLAQTSTKGNLVDRLDTLERHTNHHPYTKEQLEAAIALKEARAKRKPAPVAE